MTLPCLLKTSAFFSALVSVAVLGLSLFVLISSITPGGQSMDVVLVEKQKNITNSSDTPDMTNLPLTLSNDTQESAENSTLIISSSVSPNTTFSTTTTTFPPNLQANDTNNSSIEPPPSTTTDSATPDSEGYWDAFFMRQNDFWKSQSDTYIILIQASSGIGIFVSLLQLGFSWLLICGSEKGLKERKNLWNLSNFIVLILLIVIILVPSSYNSTNNTFKGASIFFKEVFRKFKSVEFSTNTFKTIASSVPDFLTKDLALYYYVLGVDSVILLGFLIPPLVCCLVYPCKRCCCKGKREKSESDLMLFSSGGGSFSLGDRERFF